MQTVKFFKAEHTFVILVGIIVPFIFSCKESDKGEKAVSAIKENLPIGSSFAEVESYLKKANFEYSYNNETKCFTAILREVNEKGLTSESISLVIEMDEHSKLKKLDVPKIYTGL
jgi:2C-methyl-D-erythritol 2,4-cyclodiphosphate synthase